LVNPRSHNHDPDGLRNPSEGARGFIYGTYSFTEEGSPKTKFLTRANQGGFAYLSSPLGGSSSILSFEGIQKEDRVTPSKNRGGGPRGTITGLSAASRLRLLRFLASIDYTSFEGKVFFASLTYPETWPEDPRVCKEHLESFLNRLMVEFGAFPVIWRLGIQARGAWHFHLILFLPLSFGSLKELRQFVASSWYEACGKLSEGHLLAGTNVEEIRTRKSFDYVGRYLARKEQFPEGVQTGKVWGYRNKKLLPIRWETTKVGEEDAYKIRRVFRRLQGKRGTGPLRKTQVFVRHENVAKLLKLLQDDTEWPKGARRPLPPRRLGPHKSSGSRRNEEN
jgi:hypothetical protein